MKQFANLVESSFPRTESAVLEQVVLPRACVAYDLKSSFARSDSRVNNEKANGSANFRIV